MKKSSLIAMYDKMTLSKDMDEQIKSKILKRAVLKVQYIKYVYRLAVIMLVFTVVVSFQPVKATIQKVINHFDYVMQDIKLADEKEHIQYTGGSNREILRNVEWLKSSGKQFVFRVPLIPNITDTKENLKQISEIVEGYRTELMPYNEFAGAKYNMVGMEYTLGIEKNRTEDFTRYFRNAVML